jgi:hypothetical protein
VARDPLRLDGRMIDFDRGEEYPSREIVERLLAWTRRPARRARLEPPLPERNGAQRQRAMIEAGASMRGGLRAAGARDARDLRRGGSSMSTGEDAGAQRDELRAAWEEQLRLLTAPT